MKNIPDKIYLILGDIDLNDIDEFKELSEVTWCEDKVFDSDIEYKREETIEINKKSDALYDAENLNCLYKCRNCFEVCIEEIDNYCPNCGRKIKWI